MKDKTPIVIILLILVAGLFLFKPDLLGQGKEDTTDVAFSVAPDTQDKDNLTIVYSSIVTEIVCVDVDDCVEAVREQGNEDEVRAACTQGYCVYQMERVAGGIKE